MAEGEDWLFRPVVAGMVRAESLVDGSVDLEFLAIVNEALDVKAENEYRARKAAEHGR